MNPDKVQKIVGMVGRLVITACSVFGRCYAWHDANSLPNTEEAVKTKPEQDESFCSVFHSFCLFILSLIHI